MLILSDVLMDDATLSFFRSHPERQRCLIRLLRLEDMIEADRLITLRELAEYFESGDDGAARALLQHVKARREHGLAKRVDAIGFLAPYSRLLD